MSFNMSKDNRLTNQKSYLDRARLKRKPYQSNGNPNDHEHCVFCWFKFLPQTIGYCTVDEKYWICDGCYEDFKEYFAFKLQKQPNTSQKTKNYRINLKNLRKFSKTLDFFESLCYNNHSKVNTMYEGRRKTVL